MVHVGRKLKPESELIKRCMHARTPNRNLHGVVWYLRGTRQSFKQEACDAVMHG
jgi:hypothetical protein